MAALTELTVSYSGLLRANLGNFEHADNHVSRTERWDTTGMTAEEVDALFDRRYAHLKETIDPLVEAGYYEALGKEYNPE
jgi:hypothetical protein